MGWRDTWRETVESFLREVRDPAAATAADAPDGLVSAIGAARREAALLERAAADTAERAEREAAAAAECARRGELARRIGDRETADVAQRFGARHAQRAEVLRRKHAVLRDELVVARAALHDLLDLARVDPGGD